MTIINFVTHGTSSSWVRTKHGPGVHGPPLWTGSMDPLSWTRSMDSFFYFYKNKVLHQVHGHSKTEIQSNPSMANSANSKSPLFRIKIEFPWTYPFPLRFPGYFKTPLFRTFSHFPWDLEIAGFDCSAKKRFHETLSTNAHDWYKYLVVLTWRTICLHKCSRKTVKLS